MKNKVKVCVMQEQVVAEYRCDKVLNRAILDKYKSTVVIDTAVLFKGKLPLEQIKCGNNLRCVVSNVIIVSSITKIAYGVNGVYYIWLEPFIATENTQSLENYQEIMKKVDGNEV